MKPRTLIPVRLLDQCLASTQDLPSLQAVIAKIERCCLAVKKGHSLADVLNDTANRESMAQVFGSPENLLYGLQMTARLALAQHSLRSFAIAATIQQPKKIEFLRRTLQSWKQFDTVLMAQFMEGGSLTQISFVNPQDTTPNAWREWEHLPKGTLVSVFVRSKNAGSSSAQAQEQLALERIEAAFEVVQHQEALPSVSTALVEAKKATQPAPAPMPKPRPVAASRKPLAPRPSVHSFAARAAAANQPLSHSMQIVINKMDTFVHAGNAHLIVSHLRDYPGKIQMFVLRGEKQKVQMDADSIWSAEIRNGETVVYEFYGPVPEASFQKELAKRTNKYTQMDKVAGE